MWALLKVWKSVKVDYEMHMVSPDLSKLLLKIVIGLLHLNFKVYNCVFEFHVYLVTFNLPGELLWKFKKAP